MTRHRKLRSKKAGMPPGSLVPIGEMKIPQASLSVMDFGEGGLSEYPLADPASLGEHSAFGQRWINAYGVHDPEVLASLARRFDIHPLVQEDILNTDQRQKLDHYDNALYLVLHRHSLSADSKELIKDQISLVIGRHYVLTFQEQPSNTFEPVRERLRADRGGLRRAGIGMLAYSLLDSVVDSYFALIEHLSEHAEELEKEILGKPSPRALESIHQLKRNVSHLRRNLYPLREVLSLLYRDSPDFFPPEVEIYLRDVHDHTIHILESLEDLRDLATGLLDVYMTTVSHRVNLEVRALTVVATIFMPATLIAGVFGMNFKQMPWLEDAHGFAMAMTLMACIATIMLLLFWRRRSV